MDDSIDPCVELIGYYSDRCREHLTRVRMSHYVGLSACRSHLPAGRVHGLMVRSYGDRQPFPDPRGQLATTVHKVHLVALKTNFELYLNRLLWAFWTTRFKLLAAQRNEQRKVDLKDLANTLQGEQEDRADAVRDFLIDQIIPRHGLANLVEELRFASGRRLDDLILARNPRYWAQIEVTFEVRHLVEHRDGRIDRQFRSAVASRWPRTSWGRRLDLGTISRIPVEGQDVVQAYRAMMRSTDIMQDALIKATLATRHL